MEIYDGLDFEILDESGAIIEDEDDALVVWDSPEAKYIDNTKLLNSLLDFLPPCFNIESDKELVFSIDYTAGTFVCEFKDQYCRIWTTSAVKPTYVIDLDGKTIGDLAGVITLLPGFDIHGFEGDDSSAFRIIPGTISDGLVYAFTSNMWALFQAFALELAEMLGKIKEGLRQFAIPGATGVQQDYWGSFFDVARAVDESDVDYAQRIMMSIQLPKSNNIAMEMIIQKVLGHTVQVVDLGGIDGDTMLMNNAETLIHNPAWVLYNPGIVPAEPCTFGILLEDGIFETMSHQDFTNLKNLILAVKQSGTRPKLIWRNSLGLVLLMNNVLRPINDPDWPVAVSREYYRGYYSMYLDTY